MINKKYLILTLFILAAACSRFLSPIPNFSPIMAIAIFAGTYFSDKRLAFAVPLLSMFVTDLFLGFHSTMPAVYISFLLAVFIGFQLRNNSGIVRLFLASISGSVIFFLITNFAVWLTSGMYSMDMPGLINCYTAAIAFYREFGATGSFFFNSVAGDLFYNGILFGSYALLRRYAPTMITVSSK